METPIVIEMNIRHMGEAIKTAFAERSEDYKEMIDKSIEELVDSGAIQNMVNKEVRIAVGEAISKSINSYENQQKLIDIVQNHLFQIDDNKEKDKGGG